MTGSRLWCVACSQFGAVEEVVPITEMGPLSLQPYDVLGFSNIKHPVARFLCHRVHCLARRCAFRRVQSCWSPVRTASYGRGRWLMQLMNNLMMAVPRRWTERFGITTVNDTRFMMHEKCAVKRRLRVFDTVRV